MTPCLLQVLTSILALSIHRAVDAARNASVCTAFRDMILHAPLRVSLPKGFGPYASLERTRAILRSLQRCSPGKQLYVGPNFGRSAMSLKPCRQCLVHNTTGDRLAKEKIDKIACGAAAVVQGMLLCCLVPPDFHREGM